MKKVVMDSADIYGGDNAVGILGKFKKLARRQGLSSGEIEAILTEAKSDDYDHLVSVIDSHTN